MKKKSDFYTALEETELKKQKTSSELQSQNSKPLIVHIPREAHKQLARLKLELDQKSIKTVVAEALNDLFIKYNYPPIA